MISRLPLILALGVISLALPTISPKAAPVFEQQAAPVKIESSTATEIRLGFDGTQIKSTHVGKNGDDFEVMQLPSEGLTYEYGRPLLPAVSRFVLVPANAGLEFSYTYDEPYGVMSNAPPAVCDDSVLAVPFVEPLRGLYPGKIAEMSEPFVVRGARLVKITTYPIQYDPATNSYLRYDNIQTAITYTDDEPVNPALVPIRRNRSKLFKSVIEALAINGADLGRDDPPDSEPPYVGHYLVVAHQATLGFQMVRDWIEFRRRTGYKMEILVAQNPDNPDNTKTAVQQRYNGYLDRGEDPFDYIALIGDSQYDRPADHQAQNILQTWQIYSIWGGFPHSDFLYACLEGGNDDLHPDVGYSRFPAGSEGAANLIFGRTLLYEEKPRMANPEWFTRGASYSQHWGNTPESAWHISIHTNARHGEEVLKNLGFDDVFFYELTDHDQDGSRIGPRMAEQYNRGVNVLLGRAEIYYWISSFQSVNGVNETNSDHVYPLDIVYSGHGEWALQTVFRSGAWPNNMKGPVARTCGWGWPATGPMSYIWLSMVNGVMNRDLPIGIARALSVTSIEGVFPNFQIPNTGGQLYSHIKTDTDMYGDPGLQPWIGIPRLPEVNMPETIPPSTKSLEVFVHRYRSDEPMPGAQVTMYAPGNTPPLNQPAQYGNFTGFIQKTTTADENGIARFILEDDEEFTANRPVCITASGRDIRPFTDTIRVAAVPAAVELADYELTEAQGDGNNVINPGEVFNLTILARNVGNSTDLDNVAAEAISVSPYLEVIENGEIDLGAIEHGGEVQAGVAMVLRFAPNTPDGGTRPITRPILKIHFTSGEQSWDSQIKFMPEAPNFELHSFVGSNIVDDDVQEINFDIKNTGSVDAERLTVELKSLGMGVTVVENVVTLDDLRSGDHHRLETPFTIAGNRVVVPGSKNPMVAIFSNDNGFVDSAFFELQVMRERAGAPTGPDKYGYICFDDTDTDWDMAPIYDWVEISTREDDYDFEGTRQRELEGASANDIGKCRVIDLGFTTNFYGRQYTQITVATNGFIAMGSQPRITNYSNWRMDQAMGGGVGMLAPLWDDVRFGETGAIWTYHDEESGRFIVEWERMHPANGNAEWTFQVIILDSEFWITESGDQNIVFQYKSVSSLANIRNGDTEWSNNIPFASVGISSPAGNTGLNYSFLNQRPVSAAPLQNRRALLFSTSPRYKACTLRGYVYDARTNQPIEGAQVYTEHGFVNMTDADGYWQIIDALAEVPFNITAHKQGYNDSTYVDQLVGEDSTAEFTFYLLHPEFTPSTEFLADRLDPDRIRDIPWSLYNGGNGPLFWSAEKRLIGNANADPWELRLSHNISQITNDSRTEGVVFAQDKFFVSGANVEDSTLIYILNRNGELLGSFEQINSTRYGYKDLEWDGEYIWAVGIDTIYCLSTDGQVVNSWHDPLTPSQYIAFDSERGVLYLAGTTSHIFECDRAGNFVEEHIDPVALRQRRYGMGFWPEDPDGYDLYILNRPGRDTTSVVKMNVETGDTMTVLTLPLSEGSLGHQSVWITNEYDVYSWVLMCIENISSIAGGDKLSIFQLEARKDWMNLDVWSGTLNPEETQEFVLTFDTEGLPDTLFEGELLFLHNADDGEALINIELDVIGEEPPERFDLLYPENDDTLTALPYHGDPLQTPAVGFTWESAFEWNADDTLITYLFEITTRGESYRTEVADTTLYLSLDTLGIPFWYDEVIWSVKAISGTDTADCILPFRFTIIPDAVDIDRFTPVEFGLHSIYPSPFNSATTIRFGADKPQRTSLRVFDVMGREVATLFDRTPDVGNYTIAWDAAEIPAGIYVMRLESAGRTAVQKVALIR